ncbi:uncharacterized protein N7496_004849 [Penicillium cataractarum]|uniref:FAD-binding domain-containing protein n=1 Tax=Penicillium cataractarum TaxID=2100454 RepID=A0A9W9VFC9_9EURO|nr:uncharacterized protein N7496_004849 [Penicillium cataractarum]KAJ5377440.1 hypothetical protein N7496_004849 [Penicillium cataractarum]
MSTFKVVIIGGSVAGLTLANILERYKIDYIVLEKHATIAPQLGASIATLPHGARILDQLGIFSRVEDVSMPVHETENLGPDGVALGLSEPFGDLLEELLGYRMRFMDRQQLLQVLFDGIQDKSKIHTNSECVKIEELEDSVQVALTDGSIIRGDVLVGADGVHSRIRGELWRIARSETSDYPVSEMSQSIRCQYKCMFGISKRVEGIPDNKSFKCYHKGRSYLCSGGQDGKFYWFVFVKNPEVTIHTTIPRYKAQDAENLAAEIADDPLFLDVTFKDLYKNRMSCVLVPLEEFVLKTCFFKRAILIGDSFHKMNPLLGQGGNSAIESAGLLADLLKSTLDKNPHPDNDTLQRIFQEFQEERCPRATSLMETTKKVQQMEILESPILEFLQLKVFGQLGGEQLGPILTAHSNSARTLKYLPKTYRRGVVPLDEQVKANPHDRPAIATALWVGLMLLTALFGPLLSRYLGLAPSPDSTVPVPLHNYLFVTAISITGLWTVESYRSSFLISPLFSAIPFIIASTAFGWQIILPIYFALHIYLTGRRSFYHPSPRGINPWAARALPVALLTYTPCIFKILVPSSWSGRGGLPNSGWSPSMVYIALPIILHIGKLFYQTGATKLTVGQLLYSTRDMKYLSRFFGIILVLSSTAHLVLVGRLISYSDSTAFKAMTVPSVELVQLVSLAISVVAWCCFMIWDMGRVNLTTKSPLVMLFGSFIACILVGPGAVLAALWRWRECELEHGKKAEID